MYVYVAGAPSPSELGAPLNNLSSNNSLLTNRLWLNHISLNYSLNSGELLAWIIHGSAEINRAVAVL